MQQNDTGNFFRPISTAMKIPESDYVRTDVCVAMANALARNTNHSLYIIDYNRRNFLYVSSNPLFLCGRSPEEVRQKGYASFSFFIRGTDVERYNAELGYWLAECYWNRGIMTAVLRHTIDDYFLNTDAIRIYANVYANNPASMKVLEKNGFRKCGIHEKTCFKNGEFIDCHYFELLK